MSDGSPTGAIRQEDEESSEEQWQPNHRQSERKTRFPRACTTRPSARFGHDETSSSPAKQRRHGGPVSGGRREKQEKEEFCGGGGGSGGSSSRVITPLVEQPESPAQLTRWSLRSMWELASLLDFLHVFRPLLNISAEFSAEELETALITPNSTLGDIHIPILKAIPPVTRMALGPATWVTVLCRKLRDWWHWVADGELPIVASHGTEIETYKILEPATRVMILKALCDIRVEQEDIRSYIDNSLKHGIQLSAFRKERIGGDSYGVSYWFEDDPIIGNRLYREIRQIEVKRMKGKGMPAIPLISCQWETVATNLDEFQEVSEKLFSSTNRTEVSLGKKLKIDILPDVEKIHKKKERTLKKQHRQALLLDSFLATDGLSSGRSLRDRKPVTYTFDDFDRSINEAIKITKRQSSPEEQTTRKEGVPKPETSSNGNKSNGPEHNPQQFYYDNPSPKFSEYEESDGEQKSGTLDRSNRRRKRSQRYSDKDFVEAISENDADFDSDDDIVGEVVYDEEYLRRRKQRKISSSSDGDEEYSWEGENAEEEEEDEAEDSLSMSEASDESPRLKKIPTRSQRGTKVKLVGDVQTGPRRSRRSTRPRIDYRQYELSDSEAGSTKSEKSNASDRHSDASNEPETSMPSQDSREENGVVMKDSNPNQEIATHVEEEPKHNQTMEDNNPSQEDDGSRHRRFLDLNELAPGTGFDDGPGSSVQGEDGANNF